MFYNPGVIASNALSGGLMGLATGHSIGAGRAKASFDSKTHQPRYDIKNLTEEQKKKIKRWSIGGAVGGALFGGFAMPKIQELAFRAKFPTQYQQMRNAYEQAKKMQKEEKIIAQSPWAKSLKEAKSKHEARRKYTKWAKEHHPDKFRNHPDMPLHEKKFKEIGEAWRRFQPEFESLPEGHEAVTKRPFRVPKALTRTAIGAGAGSAAGALSDKEHRKRNAAIGAGVGGLAGFGAHKYMTRTIRNKGPVKLLTKTSSMYYDQRKHILHQYPEVYGPVSALSLGLGADAMYKMFKQSREAMASHPYLKNIKEIKDFEKAFKHGRVVIPLSMLGLGGYYTAKKHMSKKAAFPIKGALAGGAIGAGLGAIGDWQQNKEFKREPKTHIRTLLGAAALAGIGASAEKGYSLLKQIQKAQDEMEGASRAEQFKNFKEDIKRKTEEAFKDFGK